MSDATCLNPPLTAKPSSVSLPDTVTLIDDPLPEPGRFWLCPHRQYPLSYFQKLKQYVSFNATGNYTEPLSNCHEAGCNGQISHNLRWHTRGNETHLSISTEIRLIDLNMGSGTMVNLKSEVRSFLSDDRIYQLIRNSDYSICSHGQMRAAGIPDFKRPIPVSFDPPRVVFPSKELGKSSCGCLNCQEEYGKYIFPRFQFAGTMRANLQSGKLGPSLVFCITRPLRNLNDEDDYVRSTFITVSDEESRLRNDQWAVWQKSRKSRANLYSRRDTLKNFKDVLKELKNMWNDDKELNEARREEKSRRYEEEKEQARVATEKAKVYLGHNWPF